MTSKQTKTQLTEPTPNRTGNEPILEARGLTRTYGSFIAVDDVDLAVEAESIHSIIGPNGAGKSTLFSLLSGIDRPTEGRVLFKGQDVTDMTVDRRARAGIIQVFQIAQLFPNRSIRENVRLAVQANFQRLNPLRHRDTAVEERAERMLEKLDFDVDLDTTAANVSHGNKKKLEIGMGIASEPDVLLLDEPTSGVSERESESLVDMIHGLRSEMAVVLVEHDIDMVLELSDVISVLHYGEIVARGDPEEIEQNEEVQRIYVGGVDA